MQKNLNRYKKNIALFIHNLRLNSSPRNILRTLLQELQRGYFLYIKNYVGSDRAVECPICGWGGEKFLPFGKSPRENARCPKCISLERHRAAYLYLKKILPRKKRIRLLHFAPEEALEELFRSYKNIEYLSADIDPNLAMVREDITHLSFNKGSLDIIFCSHVLQEVDYDLLAMRELFRVLVPGGFAIIIVPLRDITTTIECSPSISSKEREKIFRERQNFRVYGRDFKERLESAGFKVRIERFINSINREEVKKFGLLPKSGNNLEMVVDIYICKK